jgi:FkbH-like protein
MSNLAAYLGNDADLPKVEVTVTPFGQPVQSLMQRELDCWQDSPDFAIVWTQPESVISSFKDILNYKKVAIEDVLREVDEYSSLLLNLLDRVKFILVPTWVAPANNRGLGMLDLRAGLGIANTLMRMNLRLSENLSESSQVYLMDAQRWIGLAGKNAFNPKLWYMGKIAFGNDVFREAVKDVKSALRGLNGEAKKLVVVDLDNTLWGGVIGDLGVDKIKLGGHDHVGEAYVDFQRALKALTNRGILLGIVSKNEEAIAMEAITEHPEMVLRAEDFAGWRINWEDKAQNIVDLVLELNIGLQSVVFIDDNPVERSRVREALPEVFVPEWPEDSLLYKSTLLNLSCFDAPSISEEDLGRTKMYTAEKEREYLKRTSGSLNDWLESLAIKISIEELNEKNLERTVQLLNKTNQMNLTTRRMTESQLVDWVKEERHKFWTFRVADKFGDSGLTAIASVEIKQNTAVIVDFILSCRVMGRKVEETILHKIISYARSLGLTELRAEYIPTPKNKPCLRFFENSGLARPDEHTFTWNVEDNYNLPEYVSIENREELSSVQHT